jgi:hypothetical protein
LSADRFFSATWFPLRSPLERRSQREQIESGDAFCVSLFLGGFSLAERRSPSLCDPALAV